MQLTDIGLLFDMDGVIVNNHQYHFLSWKELAAKHNIPINEVYYRDHMNGRTFKRIVDELFGENISTKKAREIALEKESIYRDLYRPNLTPVAGLMAFLEEAKQHKVPMAVGTSAPEENVDFTLDGLGIRNYFDQIFDDRAVSKGKPDPEVYLKCAEGINRPSNQCIVFEDAISGIQAGKNAGSKVVALATSHSKDELSGDLIVQDFTSLDLDRILSLLNS